MIDKRVIACVLENHVVWVVDLGSASAAVGCRVAAQTVVTAAYGAMASTICPGPGANICPAQ